MTALEIAIEIIKKFEGCRLKAYKDWVGVWTIGYGETEGVTEGMIWTQEEAEARLKASVTRYLVNVLTKCPQLNLETPSRVAACVSLAYNIGISGFSISSVCRKTKMKDYQGAADSFLLWNKAGGKVDKILTLRRKKERDIYLGNITIQQS